MNPDLIPSAASTALLAVTVGSARWRGRRTRDRHEGERSRLQEEWARADKRTDRVAASASRMARHANDLIDELGDTQERLVSAEHDRDLWQAVAARHLTRAWRAERALAAVRARDDAAAYAPVVEAERIAKQAAR